MGAVWTVAGGGRRPRWQPEGIGGIPAAVTAAATAGVGTAVADGRARGYSRWMVDTVATQLVDVDVLTTDGERVKLGSLFEGRAVLLAMIRHFG